MPTALADGTYNVQATATDNAGNVGTDTTTNELIVDTVNPAVTVTKLFTNNNKPTLTGTVVDPAPSSGIAGVTLWLAGKRSRRRSRHDLERGVPTAWPMGRMTSRPRPRTTPETVGSRYHDQ